MPRSSAKATVCACAVAIALAAFITYWPARTFEFVNYDDHRYITRNPRVQQGLNADNIAWAFTTFEVANWHPLTWLSHMLDVSVFGGEADAAGRHHMMNVALHAINSALVLLLFWRMTGAVWRSALVAALFALHPLHVESVAWVSERKDLLSTLFGLLAMLAYVRFVRQRDAEPIDPPQSRGFGAYALVTLCMALSLLCKPMFVTLPAVLVLLDIWPLRRANLTRGLIEKLPLLALSLASATVTMLAQRSGGAVAGVETISVFARIENAIVAYAIYLRQTVWPTRLSPYYPHPVGTGGWPTTTAFLAVFALLAISVACVIAFRRGNRAPLIGWLWYLGTLVPVIGLVQVGMQAHADRYTYVPLIGVFIMVAWSVSALPSRTVRAIAATLAIASLVALALVTRHQAMFWRDSVALSQQAIAVTSDNAVAHFNLANAFIERGQISDAKQHLLEAQSIDPRWADVPYNLGNIALRENDLQEAAHRYQQALDVRPGFAAALNNMGLLNAQGGRLGEAIVFFRKAVAAAPRFGDARLNLGNALLASGNDADLAEAIASLRAAAELMPDDPVAHWRLGIALLRFKQPLEASEVLATAIARNPLDPRPRIDLAAAMLQVGRNDLALAHLQQAWDIARQMGDADLQTEIERQIGRLRSTDSASQPQFPRS